MRNGVGVFDTSPLFKYRIQGPDAERFLAGVLVRDIRTCRPGQAQYTLWCDDRGFVMEDGVVLPALGHRVPADRGPAERSAGSPTWSAGCGSRSRTSPTTTASSRCRVRGRGPCCRALMPEAEALGYFDHAPAKIGSAPGHPVAHRLHR